jgi:hypothetical protein
MIYLQFAGSTQLSELVDCIEEVVFDPHFQSEYKVLIKIHAHYIPTAAEMKHIARLIMKLEPQFKNKVALAVLEPFLHTMFDMATYYIKKKTEINIEIFHDTAKAFDWLRTN